MNKKNEICLIAPTKDLAMRAQKIIKNKNLNISVHIGALEDAIIIAEKLIKQGTWLFISRLGTRSILEKKLHITVVNIPMVASDYIPAIEKVRHEKGIIALFSFEPCSDELKTICYLLNIKIKHYRFYDTDSCNKCVNQAKRDGAVWGIGGIVGSIYAKEIGLPYIVVESSESSIEQSIESACQIYDLQKESEKKQEELEIKLERYQNILNYTHDAIIAVDSNGMVDVINKVAENILDPNNKPYIGKYIEQVLPNTRMTSILRTGIAEIEQLMTIHGTAVSTNRVPIVVNGSIKGVVSTFQDIKHLQNAERNIRIKLHEKGLTAKYRFSDIIGTSSKIIKVKELAESFSDSNFTVMLYGETGTGKEMFAQSIHNASPRANGPFVAINCTALSKSLLESELFGYADGSFTGAKKGGKPGLFETAHGGTIFLDEIGELPLEVQSQFLRVIQGKEVRRVGGNNIIPVDIRVIGATNKNLLQLVNEGKFRRDLYYRLNVLTVNIPALRERDNDFLQIAEFLYDNITHLHSKEEKDTLLKVLNNYSTYNWPGNVRELNNFVERIYLLQKHNLSENRIIESLNDMSLDSFRNNILSDSDNILENFEISHIKSVLNKNNGNISKTAKELKISRSTLYRKINKI